MKFWWAKIAVSITAGVLVGLSAPVKIWAALLISAGATVIAAFVMDGFRLSYELERKRQAAKAAEIKRLALGDHDERRHF